MHTNRLEIKFMIQMLFIMYNHVSWVMTQLHQWIHNYKEVESLSETDAGLILSTIKYNGSAQSIQSDNQATDWFIVQSRGHV